MAISSLRLLAFYRNAQLRSLLENCGCWPLHTIGHGFEGLRRRRKLNQLALLFVLPWTLFLFACFHHHLPLPFTLISTSRRMASERDAPTVACAHSPTC